MKNRKIKIFILNSFSGAAPQRGPEAPDSVDLLLLVYGASCELVALVVSLESVRGLDG